MHLYDPDENEGQALFFNPAKVARVRQRNADAEEAERRRKQNADDKKLQLAVARAEKAREAQEKKNRRAFERQAARAQLAQEKAERKAARETKQAQKAAELAERRRITAEKKARRTRARKSTIQSSIPKKRAIEVEGSERPQKRPRTHLLQSRDTTISPNSTPVLDTRGIELSDNPTAVNKAASQVVRRRNAPRRLVSVPLRSGRSRNLPVRFRS
jgi:hypothetical protein